jgi:WD40 repeat protein
MELEVPIVPLLIDGAEMPTAADLPKDLRDFIYFHGESIDSGRHFHPNMDAVIEQIDRLVPRIPGTVPVSPLRPDAAGLQRDVPRGEEPVARILATEEHGGEQGSQDRRHMLWKSFPASAVLGRFSGTRALAGTGMLGLVLAVGLAGYQLWPAKSPLGIGVTQLEPPLVRPMLNQAKEVRAVVFSPAQTVFAVAGDDGVIRIWDASTFKLLRRLPSLADRASGHTASVRKIAFSMDGSKLASASWDGTVRLWDTGTGQLLAVLEDKANATKFFSVAVFHDAAMSWVLGGGADGKIRTWDLRQGMKSVPVRGTPAHTGEVFALSFAPDNTGNFVSAGRDGYLNLYGRAAAEPTRIVAHRDGVFDVKYSRSGHTLLTAGKDGNVKTWSGAGPTVQKIYEGRQKYALTADWSPDGMRIAGGGNAGIVRIWNVDSTQTLDQLKGHAHDIETVAFHPKGPWLLSGSEDKLLKVWHVSGEERFSIAVFNDDEYLAYMPNGHFTGTPNAHRFMQRVTPGGDRALSPEERMSKFMTPDHFASMVR